MSRAIVPFWRDLRTAALGECYFWVIRYSRGGEHLKIRIHGAEEDREALQRLLGGRVENYLEMVRGLPPATPRADRRDVPPIDAEDELPAAPGDRSLAWTTYRRSPVSLPPSPWLDDDRFAAHACQCLSRGCELVLAEIEAGNSESKQARQKLLIKALLSGLGALGLGEPRRAVDYLGYHRDWLLRFFLDETAKEQLVMEQFEERVRHMSATIQQLRLFAPALWAQKPANAGGLWERALSGLAEYLAAFRNRDEYQLDPFTTDVTFLPVFKVLHGLANQLGMPPIEEAYVHHVVRTAVAGVADQVAATPALKAMAL